MKKITSKLSKYRDQVAAASYTVGSSAGVGALAYTCDIPQLETAFMMGMVIMAGAVISYTKSVDKNKDCE